MAGTEWVRWVFAAMFTALTIFYVARLVSSRRDAGWDGGAWSGTADRGVDASRGVMSIGMVAMLVPWVDPLPRLSWQVIFGVAAAHIAVRLIRRRARSSPAPSAGLCGQHEVHLIVGGLAMVYMLTVMPAGRAMAAGMEMAGMHSVGPALPVLAWAFIAYFLVFVVWLGARLAMPATETLANRASNAALGGGPRDVVISPHLLGSSELVMAIGMVNMLMTIL